MTSRSSRDEHPSLAHLHVSTALSTSSLVVSKLPCAVQRNQISLNCFLVLFNHAVPFFVIQSLNIWWLFCQFLVPETPNCRAEQKMWLWQPGCKSSTRSSTNHPISNKLNELWSEFAEMIAERVIIENQVSHTLQLFYTCQIVRLQNLWKFHVVHITHQLYCFICIISQGRHQWLLYPHQCALLLHLSL